MRQLEAMNSKIESKKLIFLIAGILYLAAGVALVLIVAGSGGWPSGDNSYYYIFRGNSLYNSIKAGNFYSVIDLKWYNGLENFKSGSFMMPYCSAFCQWLAGGDALNGYLVFLFFGFLIGAFAWLVMGYLEDRPLLGAVFGLYWFFVPGNLYALFAEGDMARSMALAFIPFFMYGVYSYLKDKAIKRLVLVLVSLVIIGGLDLNYAVMTALAAVVLIIIYCVSQGRYRMGAELMTAMLIAFLVMGIWLVPYLISGGQNVDTSETLSKFFQNLLKSINPIQTAKNSAAHYYFGLSGLILGVFGIFFARKEEKSTFICGILTLLCSAASMYVILRALPGGKYLRMVRFFSLASCLMMLGMIYWKSLKKYFVIGICLLLVADVVPVWALVKGDGTGISPTTTLDEMDDYTLIEEAKSITTQRMALLDLSSMASMGSYLVGAYNDGVNSSFGTGWEIAETATNIRQLNRALEQGYYLYLFDRAVELGNDTVLIVLSEAETIEHSPDDITEAAEQSGYTLVDSLANYLLYHLEDAPESFGVISQFDAIGIGSGAGELALSFPQMEETDRDSLDDYTYEELAGYDLIYLDGFTYEDKDYAEELILKLSENGVRVVIAADDIPQSRKSHDQSFLGVKCNSITFSNGYPELDTIDGTLNTDLFPSGYSKWNTVYLEGLSDVWGTVYDNDLNLPFYGTGQNENLVYIGINLSYFYGLTGDEAVGKLLSHAMNLEEGILPERQLVPISTKFDGNTITITSDYDNVNTTLAYSIAYTSDGEISKNNNLTYVNAGTTVINIKYPYIIWGIIVSVLGIVLFALFLLLVKREKERLTEKENESKEDA